MRKKNYCESDIRPVHLVVVRFYIEKFFQPQCNLTPIHFQALQQQVLRDSRKSKETAEKAPQISEAAIAMACEPLPQGKSAACLIS